LTDGCRVDSRQPGQGSGIEPIILATALADQEHLPRMGHDHFVTQVTQQPTYPLRVHPCFRRDPAAWHPAEDFLHGLRRCRQLLFQKQLQQNPDWHASWVRTLTASSDEALSFPNA